MGHPAACLFDLDGLLLDTEPLHAEAWQQAASHFGRPLQPQELMQLRGRRRHDCSDKVRSWIAAAGGPELTGEQLLAVRQPIAEALLPTAAAMPGAQRLVERCEQLAIPMALATSSAKQAVALKASPHPWLELIAVRVHGDDPQLRQGKPAPDVFLLAAERLGVASEACWAFEDSPAGAAAAVAAGSRVHVLAPETLAPNDRLLLYPGVHRWLQSLEEIVEELG